MSDPAGDPLADALAAAVRVGAAVVVRDWLATLDVESDDHVELLRAVENVAAKMRTFLDRGQPVGPRPCGTCEHPADWHPGRPCSVTGCPCTSWRAFVDTAERTEAAAARARAAVYVAGLEIHEADTDKPLPLPRSLAWQIARHLVADGWTQSGTLQHRASPGCCDLWPSPGVHVRTRNFVAGETGWRAALGGLAGPETPG